MKLSILKELAENTIGRHIHCNEIDPKRLLKLIELLEDAKDIAKINYYQMPTVFAYWLSKFEKEFGE